MTFFGRAPRRLTILPAGATPRSRGVAGVRAELLRRSNFLATANLAVAVTSTIPGALTATHWTMLLDELALVAIAAFAVHWYLSGRDCARPTLVPLVLLTLGFGTKLVGAWVAHALNSGMGVDLAVALFLVSTAVVVVWQLVAIRRLSVRTPAGTVVDEHLIEALRQRVRLQHPPLG